MLVGELDRLVEGNHRASIDQFRLDVVARFEHELDRAIDIVDGSTTCSPLKR